MTRLSTVPLTTRLETGAERPLAISPISWGCNSDWPECLPCTEKVQGSNPCSSTMAIVNYLYLVLRDGIEAYVYFNKDFEVEMIRQADEINEEITLEEKDFKVVWAQARKEIKEYSAVSAKNYLLKA